MNELSLFSGAGGGLLATKHLLGWKTIGYVEIEPYCQEVLKARIRDGYLDPAPIFGDIRRFISEGYAASYQGMVDVVTGGFPCQDISAAGKGAGITGERSGLWKSMAEVVRQVRPRYVFVENSPMLTIRGLGTVLGDLASMGFDAEWGVLGSADAGLPTARDRIWVVACSSMRVSNPRANVKKGRAERLLEKWTPDSCERNIVANGLAVIQIPSSASVDYGMAYWLDELKAIGNGQVPRVVELAWKILSEKG